MNFNDFIDDLNGGQTKAEINHQLKRALESVRNTGKQSVLTLKFKIGNASKNNGLTVDKLTVTPQVELVLPKTESETDFFWITDSNELSRKHPKQQELELKDTANVIEFKKTT